MGRRQLLCDDVLVPGPKPTVRSASVARRRGGRRWRGNADTRALSQQPGVAEGLQHRPGHKRQGQGPPVSRRPAQALAKGRALIRSSNLEVPERDVAETGSPRSTTRPRSAWLTRSGFVSGGRTLVLLRGRCRPFRGPLRLAGRRSAAGAARGRPPAARVPGRPLHPRGTGTNRRARDSPGALMTRLLL